MSFLFDFLRNDSLAFKMLCHELGGWSGVRAGIKLNQILTDQTGPPQASTERPEAKAWQELLLHTERSVTTLTKPITQKNEFQDSLILAALSFPNPCPQPLSVSPCVLFSLLHSRAITCNRLQQYKNKKSYTVNPNSCQMQKRIPQSAGELEL